MAIINMNDFEKATQQEAKDKMEYFSLKDDGDKAVVRFLYESYDDLKPVAVHTIKVNDKDRYVNCIREYDEPKDNCPLCKAGIKTKVRAYIELMVYQKDSNGNIVGTPMIWERGADWVKHKFKMLCERYNPICDTVFEIERSGKKGSTDTTYETFPLPPQESEKYALEALPEQTLNPVGKMVIDASAEDLEYYVKYNALPQKQSTNATNAQPQQSATQAEPVQSVPQAEQAPSVPQEQRSLRRRTL